LIGGAPKSGITIAFIRNLNAMPNAIPPATVRIQLLGRTYPISRQGVRDNRAQTSTKAAPAGRTIMSPTVTFPVSRIERITTIPSGPKPRRAAAKRSLDGVAASVLGAE